MEGHPTRLLPGTRLSLLPLLSAMRLPLSARLLQFAAWSALAIGFNGCVREAPRTAANSVSPAPVIAPPATEEEIRVVAIVEQLHRAAHEEWFEIDGEPRVLVSNVVAFAIVRPEDISTLLFAHVSGHPRIGDRPLLLGDAVTFMLPRNWQSLDLALADLPELAFAGGATSEENR